MGKHDSNTRRGWYNDILKKKQHLNSVNTKLG